MEDIPALDALQKKHGKALGFFPRAQMEGYVRNQWVLVAVQSGASPHPSPLPKGEGVIGYIASRDRYLKRDELGIIYQLCVAPGAQRKLVGAALVREVFARSAYGCRLYCCWCAQDLAANHFWEAMGFAPIAFRAGSSGKKRVHIFWQKRIVEGDTETKWWYPSETNQGAIREDRLVFPSRRGRTGAMPSRSSCLPRAASRGPGRGRRCRIRSVRSRGNEPSRRLGRPWTGR
jgi:ribosomal protein S18 acetylase RimI-like enzyme